MTYKECYCNGEVLYAENLNADRNALKSGINNSLKTGIYATCIAFCGSYGDLTPYADAIVDIYSDSSGYLNTVNTGNTTAIYNEINDSYYNIDCCGCLLNASFITCCCYRNCSNGSYENFSCCNCTISKTSGESGMVVCNLWEGCQTCVDGIEYIGISLCATNSINNSGTASTVTELKLCSASTTYTLHTSTLATTGTCSFDNCFELIKTCDCHYNLYKDSSCLCEVCFDTNLICQRLRTCAYHTQVAGVSNARLCLSSANLYVYAEKIIEINAQSFDSTTNAIYPTLELSEGSKDDITVDVEDGSSNNLACDVSLDDFGNFSTCCPCVLVKYKLGGCDIKKVKAHGYKVMSL